MSQILKSLTNDFAVTKNNIESSRRSLVIIDSSVDDIELLKTGLELGAEVVVLHPQFDGIEQITALVSRRNDLQKVHLVSHGSSGSLRLGNSELSLDNIDKYSTQLQTWFGNCSDRVASRKHRVSLLIYGCQVAANDRGKSFVRKLHQLTGANIAASTRTVGSPTNDGVWQLDYSLGQVNAELAFSNEVIQTYSGIFQDEEPLTNFEAAEIQVQIFAPDLESPTSDPITAVVNDGIEFDDDLPPSDNLGDNLFPANVDIDLAGGVAGEGSIFIEVDEDQTPDTFISGDFNGYVFTDVSGNLPAIENVALNESSNTLGLEPDDVTFSENAINVNVESLVAEPGFTALLDVEFGEAETESEPDAEEEPAAEEPVAEEAIEEESTAEEPVAEEAIEEEPIEEPVADADTTEIIANEVIDLSTVAEGESVYTVFNVNREAAFDNTVDFYEVDADGSVVDDSGKTIAIGEADYTKAAVDNHVGLELSTENGTVSKFYTELEGGKIYAPLIAVDNSIEALSDDNPDNDPAVYFTYPEANADGFDHVQNSKPNVFEFEDIAGGGDLDFDDLVVEVLLDETAKEPVEKSVEEAPVEEPVAEEPVEEAPVEELVVEEPVEKAPVEELVVEEPVEEAPVEEPVAEEPVEPSEDSATLNNFEGAEIQLQVFDPNLDEPAGEPLTAIVEEGVEFDNEEVLQSDLGTNPFQVVDVNIDIAGGAAGEGSISFEVDEDQPSSTFNSADFNGYVFTDISGDLPAIENVTLNESSTTLGINSSDISFTGDTIEVNVESVAIEPGLTALLDIDFAGV